MLKMMMYEESKKLLKSNDRVFGSDLIMIEEGDLDARVADVDSRVQLGIRLIAASNVVI